MMISMISWELLLSYVFGISVSLLILLYMKFKYKLSYVIIFVFFAVFSYLVTRVLIKFLLSIIYSYNYAYIVVLIIIAVLFISMILINFLYFKSKNVIPHSFIFLILLLLGYVICVFVISDSRLAYIFISNIDKIWINFDSVIIIIIASLLLMMNYFISYCMYTKSIIKSLKRICKHHFSYKLMMIWLNIAASIILVLFFVCFLNSSLSSTLNNHICNLKVQENNCKFSYNKSEQAESPSNNCVKNNIHLENKLINCHNKKNKDNKLKIIHIYHIKYGHLIYYVNNEKLKGLLNGSKHAKFYLYKIQNNKLCFKYDSHIAGSANVNIKLNLELNKNTKLL